MAKALKIPDVVKSHEESFKIAFDRVVAAGLEGLLSAMPVESGHGHEAFISAADKAIPGPQTERVLSRFDQDRSGDPKARRAGKGKLKLRGRNWRFRISAHLPFLVVLDQGGVLSVTGNRTGGTGTKKGGVRTIGQLYAKRRQFTGGRHGVLMWQQGGRKRFARVRNFPVADFMSAAYSSAKKEALR